jgi:hypothetical protein
MSSFYLTIDQIGPLSGGQAIPILWEPTRHLPIGQGVLISIDAGTKFLCER